MKNIAFLLSSALILICCHTIGQGTKIISIQEDAGYQGTIMSYDFVSKSYDTIYHIPNSTVCFNEESAIDGFNGRYFFGASITGFPNYTIFSFDITTKIITPLFQMNSGADQGIEYDCFTNSIIYRDTDSLKRYDISSGIKSTICKMPQCTNVLLSGFARTYNYFDQQLLFIAHLAGSSDFYFILVDALHGSLIDTTLIPSNGFVTYLTYDIVTNSFYGISENGSVSKIDSVAGNQITICSPPPNFFGGLNRQRAVFDSYNGYYLHPYYSTNNENKIAITDVSNSTIIEIDSFPMKSNFERFYSMQNALLKLHNGILTSSYAEGYEWYLNDTLIVGVNTQIFIPTQNGNYKVKETHLDGRVTISNIVTINSLGVPNYDFSKNNILIYPNPFSTQTTLKTNKFLKDATLTVYNSYGRQVTQLKNIFGQSIILHRDNLPSGFYFLQLTQDNKILITDKIVITDK